MNQPLRNVFKFTFNGNSLSKDVKVGFEVVS